MYAVRFAIYKGEERRKRGNNTTPTGSKSSILIYAETIYARNVALT
jgi:hypothetical protein